MILPFGLCSVIVYGYFADNFAYLFDRRSNAVAESVDLVRERLLSIQDIMLEISRVNTDRLDELENLGSRSENDGMTTATVAMMKAIDGIIDEVGHISDEASNGNVRVRGDESKFQ